MNKLLVLLVFISFNCLAAKAKYKLYSEVVTNWTSVADHPTWTAWRYFDKNVESSGEDIGTVKSNYYASLFLAGTSNYILLDSKELFVISKLWTDVKKVERVYRTVSLYTNIFVTNYCERLVLTNFSFTNLYAINTNTLTITNALK